MKIIENSRQAKFAKTNLFGVPKLGPLWSKMTEIVRTARKWPKLQDPVIFGQIQPFLQPSIKRFSTRTADLDHMGPPFWARNG